MKEESMIFVRKFFTPNAGFERIRQEIKFLASYIDVMEKTICGTRNKISNY
jgi:hypothetical protein